MAKAAKKTLNIDFNTDESKTPKYKVEDNTCKKAVSRIRAIDVEMEALKTERNDKRNQILEVVEPIKLREEKAGNLYKTFLVEAAEGDPATVLYKNAYSALPMKNETEMVEELGADLFNELYEVKSFTSLNPKADMDELQRLLGNRFDSFFVTNFSITHTEEFMEKRTAMRKKLPKAVNEMIDDLTKKCQASPDLRVPKKVEKKEDK